MSLLQSIETPEGELLAKILLALMLQVRFVVSFFHGYFYSECTIIKR